MATVDEIAREQNAVKDDKGWTAVRVWEVKLDSHIYAAYSAVLLVATAEADIGDKFPLNPYLFLKKLTPSRSGESRLVWRVRGDYEQLKGNVGRVENPLDEPSTATWGTIRETVPVVSAFNAEGERKIAVVNSAGQPFDPPLTEPRTRLVASIRYNSEDFDPSDANEFQESVNDEPVTIGTITVRERMAKIIEYSAEPQEFNGINYWSVTIKVEINTNETLDAEGEVVAQGFDREVLDQGIFELKDPDLPATDKLLVRMTTDDKEEVTEPLKLDGEGKKLNPQTKDPVFLPFKTNRQKNFGPLRLEVNS